MRPEKLFHEILGLGTNSTVSSWEVSLPALGLMLDINGVFLLSWFLFFRPMRNVHEELRAYRMSHEFSTALFRDRYEIMLDGRFSMAFIFVGYLCQVLPLMLPVLESVRVHLVLVFLPLIGLVVGWNFLKYRLVERAATQYWSVLAKEMQELQDR